MSEFIPPAIRLLIDEPWGNLDSFEDFYKRHKSMARELSAQAEYGLTGHNYFDSNSDQRGKLVISAGGGLNPFSERDICSAPKCRIKTTREIIQTLGLYADVITIPDSFSLNFVERKNPTREQSLWLLNNLLVLRELAPLIRAGIVRFWSGRIGYCSSCFDKAEQKIDESTSELTESIDKYIHAEENSGFLAVRTTGIFETPFIYRHKITTKDKKRLLSGVTLNDLAKEKTISRIRQGIKESLFDLHHSTQVSSALFSTSRRELLALKSFDTDAPALSSLAVWERARSIQLPWVSALRAEQIIRLRENASQALPAFRGTFLSHVASPNATLESVEKKIETLREGAFEVERELRALNPAKEQTFRNMAGALGLTISVYGFAADFAAPALALGGLISMLGLVHASKRHDEQKEAQLRANPAYVLLSAKELAEHA